MGTIEGSMDNFRTLYYSNDWDYDTIDEYNEVHTVSYPGRLNLEQANTGDANSGFFDDTVSGNLNGRDYTENGAVNFMEIIHLTAYHKP